MDNGERRFFEDQFKELRADMHALREDVVALKTDVAALKVKSSVWGAAIFAAAMIAVILSQFVFQ